MRKIVLLYVVIICSFILAACSANEEESVEEASSTSVETTVIQKDNLQVTKSIYGMIVPSSQMPVMVEQTGEIKELKVKNGDTVSKDDTLATVKTPMGDISIKAPKAGKIAQLKVQEGDLQTNEEPLATIANIDTLKMTFAISANDQSIFKTDKKIQIHIDDKKYEGKILPLDPLPNDAGQFDIEAEIDNKDEDIKPGATGQVRIKETKVKDALIVPTEAILHEAEEDYVYIVEDGKAKRIIVEILETQTELSAIEGEIKEEDEVIVNGHFTLSDGSDVEVVKDGNEA